MLICTVCNDTHVMELDGRDVMCTYCPTPCQRCRKDGNGPYCETTPCACACHAQQWQYVRASGVRGPPDSIIQLAIETANKGPCAKSKRGVVIWCERPGEDSKRLPLPQRYWPLAEAFNSPPWPYECSATDECKRDCGRVCVHAEQRAIIDCSIPDRAITRSLIHVKTVDGKLVTSPKGPSCDQCSKLILEAGIGEVWLYESTGVWSRYDATSFHRITLRNRGLHIHL